ncbi:CpaF family protein [soil metagenome]
MKLDQFIKSIQDRKSQDSTESPPAAVIKAEPESEKPVTAAAVNERGSANASILENNEQFKQRVHSKLVEKIDPNVLRSIPEARQRADLRRVLEQIIDGEIHPMSLQQRRALIEEILDDTLGFGPLERLLRDPTITDILINGAHNIYVERKGVLVEDLEAGFRDNDQLLEIIQRIVSRVGRRVNESSPMVDARLPDGSRFNAIIPPLALDGPLVSIRRFGKRPLKIVDLLALKAITPEMARYLESAVKARLNILVSGGTGSGKTTLLNALSSFIPVTERIVTIEDAAELRLQQHHVGRLEARPANNEGSGEITIRDLVRNALRMRPDRIVIGECRGAEAFDMLQAMNTGHEGSLTTLHANTPRDALSRLETMILMSGLELPIRAMRQQIASAINVIIQVERLPGGPRRVTRITEVTGMEQDIVTLQDLFAFEQAGVDTAGRAYGEFKAIGIATHYEERFRARGVSLPPDFFRARVLLAA